MDLTKRRFSELFLILLQGNLNQLRARTDAELVEQLPEGSLHGSLGNLQLRGDILVG